MFISFHRRPKFETELDDELKFHIEKQVEENIAAGMSEEEARYAAKRQFGDLAQRKDECRDARRMRMVEDVLQDLRYALRMLRRSPGFTVVAVLSLALGIGVNTALFSVADAVLLKMLPVREPDRLVLLGSRSMSVPNFAFSTWQYQDLQDHAVFSGLSAFRPWRFRIGYQDQTELAEGQLVSGNYYGMLGVPPLLGRVLTPADDAAAVVSHRYWQSRFGGDPKVIGRTINLFDHPFTIVGITPPEFFGTETGAPVDVTIPLAAQRIVLPGAIFTHRDTKWLRLIGRLQDGVTRQQAQAKLGAKWTHMFPGETAEVRRYEGKLTVLDGAQGINNLRRRFSTPLRMLMGLAGFVLLVACANLAALLLARAAARQPEIEIRRALGASATRLIRQLLTESVLLACAGGALGIAVSYAAARLLPLDVKPGLATLAFGVAVSLFTGLLFGVLPALHAAKRKKAERTSRIVPGEAAWSRTLLSAQVALCLVLLTVSGLFVRTLRNLRSIDSGYRRDHVLLVNIRPSVTTALKEIYARLSELPGVISATLSMDTPMQGVSYTASLQGKDYQANFNSVGPRFFETMGTPLIAGRDFRAQDNESAPRVAILSETLARRYFPALNPIGQHVAIDESTSVEIIGVAKDVKYENLREQPRMMIYRPYLQTGCCGDVWYALRTAGDPMAMLPAVRREVREPLYAVTTLEAVENATIAKEWLLAEVSSFFGLIVVSLAAIGLYGVLSYTIARGAKEIGVRMALGANAGGIAGMTLRQSLAPVVIGTAFGIPAALVAASFCRSVLFGLNSNDPLTIWLAIGVMGLVAIGASFLPALRASRMDPMTALREE